MRSRSLISAVALVFALPLFTSGSRSNALAAGVVTITLTDASGQPPAGSQVMVSGFGTPFSNPATVTYTGALPSVVQVAGVIGGQAGPMTNQVVVSGAITAQAFCSFVLRLTDLANVTPPGTQIVVSGTPTPYANPATLIGLVGGSIQYAGKVGPVQGPMVTRSITCQPIVDARFHTVSFEFKWGTAVPSAATFISGVGPVAHGAKRLLPIGGAVQVALQLGAWQSAWQTYPVTGTWNRLVWDVGATLLP